MRLCVVALMVASMACQKKPVKVTAEDELAVLTAIIHENCYGKQIVDKQTCLRLIYIEQKKLATVLCDESMDPLCSKKR